MNPQPSWDDLRPYYDDMYNAYNPSHGANAEDSEVIWTAKQTGFFRHIAVTGGQRLLDVGCGGGYFLRIMKKLGFVEQGVEPSKSAAATAQRNGLRVFHGTLEEFASQATEKFDIITSNHVIEHVPDPIETFATMKRLLDPNGFIWIAVPNAAYPLGVALNGLWHSTDLPYHLMQFNPNSIAMAGKAAGLRVRNQVTESIPAMVEASLGQYFRYRWMLPGILTRKSRALGPLARWYARRMDERLNGEAIITEFTA